MDKHPKKIVIGDIEIEHQFTWKDQFIISQRFNDDSVKMKQSDISPILNFMIDRMAENDSGRERVGGLDIEFSHLRKRFYLTDRYTDECVIIHQDEAEPFIDFVKLHYY